MRASPRGSRRLEPTEDSNMDDATGIDSKPVVVGRPKSRIHIMKAQNRFFTRSQILRLAPLLLCATAGAAPVLLKETNDTNVWTLPTGANLLNASLVTDTPPPSAHGNPDVTSGTWTPLTDGVVDAFGVITNAVAPTNGMQATFPLDISVNTNGYTLTQFDSYSAWPDAGRINQDYVLEYSKVSDPFTFLPLTTVSNPSGGTNKAVHTKITDSTGTLATNVHSIRFTFNNQQNGYVGYREFILQGTAVPVSDPLTWTGASGSGGNANWVTTLDNNWKNTVTGVTAPYSSIANLTFETATNRNITIASPLTSAFMSFSNTSSNGFTFGGAGLLTVTSDIVATGDGPVTFNNPLTVNSGISARGAGTLTVGGALQTKTLELQSGTVKLTGATPVVGGLSSFGGTLTLGNTSPVVNTVLTVGNETSSEFDANIGNASGAKGGVTKVGTGTLILSGNNQYTGVTNVAAGQLEFALEQSLYGGNSASWTASNLLVSPGAALVLRVGGGDEFTTDDLAALKTGGMQAGSFLGFDTLNGDFELATPFTGITGLLKKGLNTLTLSTANTYTGGTKILGGAINAANLSGPAIPGNVTLGDGSEENFLNFGADNQLSPTAVVTFANGIANTKMQLRGTSQTIAGLDSAPTNERAIIQSDETGTPGFVEVSTTPSTLTIDTTSDHSFAGLIRNADGGPLAIVKQGPATQEFRNVAVQSSSNTGGLFVDEGTVKMNFSGANAGWGAPVHIAAGANFVLDGAFTWGMSIDGAGHVAKQGTGTVTKISVTDTYSGGTTVEAGTLRLAGGGAVGEGITPDDPGSLGVKNASNPVIVNSGATLMLSGIAVLGNSFMLPQYGYVVTVNGGTLSGGDVPVVAFVTNLTLNGGKVDITNGGNAGNFATNLGLVGTVIVGGTTPSTISTSGTGLYANASLGDLGLTGTTFQVADVTGNASDDLVVSSILQDVIGHPSALTKTGPGTMHLSGANTYTGDTKVNAGTLILDQPSLADTSNITIASGAFLSLNHTQADTVGSLTINGVQMAAGIYVATTNNAAGAIKTASITGTGSLVVAGSTGSGYDAWSTVIPDTTKRGRDADPDGDGFKNIDEYLFGTSPIASTGALSTSERTTGNVVVRWNQLATGSSTYVLQESTDLVTWVTSTAAIINDPVQGSTSYTLKQATIPVSGVRKFVRIQATE
ncbi:MAG: hypothetical protein JWO82_341 [Akkermansiaceae bacterium]|nr:hypothetical protein [Akkermansiaceae bacterium]